MSTATSPSFSNDWEFATLPAGNDTAVVRCGDGTTGIALVEV